VGAGGGGVAVGLQLAIKIMRVRMSREIVFCMGGFSFEKRR
jgi:hypothetical protein